MVGLAVQPHHVSTTAQRQWLERDDLRSRARILGAAIVAGGLAFSVSLYPTPEQSAPLDLWRQDRGGLSSGLPSRIAAAAGDQITDFTNQITGLTNLELPALVQLAGILHDTFPTVGADVLLAAVQEHGLPEVIRALEIVASAQLPPQAAATLLAGAGAGAGAGTGAGAGGGAGAGAGASPTTPPLTLPDFGVLLEMLMHQLPAYMVRGISDIIATLLPTMVSSAEFQQMAQVLSAVAPVPVMVPSPSVTIQPPPPAISTPTPAAPPPAEHVSTTPAALPPPEPVSTTPAPSTPAEAVPSPSPSETAPPPTIDLGNTGTDVIGYVPETVGPSQVNDLGNSGGSDDTGSGGGSAGDVGDGASGGEAGGNDGSTGGSSSNSSGDANNESSGGANNDSSGGGNNNSSGGSGGDSGGGSSGGQ